MERSALRRPTGITIAAWLWIVMGGFMIFSGVLGGFANTVIGNLGPPPLSPAEMPTGYSVIVSLFQHSRVLFFLQCIVAVVAVGAGVALLRLKAWARTAIEALSWIGFVYTVGFGILWAYVWISMAGQMPGGSAPANSESFQTMGAVAGVIINAGFAVPLWMMIRYLRRGEVRAAIADARRAKA